MSNRIKIAGFVFSVVLHLLLLFLILPPEPKYPKLDPDPDSIMPMPVEVRLIPKFDPSLTSETKIVDEGNRISYPIDDRVCNGKDKSYKGIGIIYNPGTHIITHAPEYYPGYKAGLRVGDFIVEPEVGPVGDYITFDVLRLREQFRLHIKTDNICFQEG